MSQSLGEAFFDILADTSGFGDSLSTGITDAVDSATDAVSGSMSGVSDEIEGTFGQAGEAAGDALADGIQGSVDDINVGDGVFDGMVGEADEAAAGVGAAFEGVGAEIEESLSGTFDGVAGSLGSLQGALGTAAGGAGLEGFSRSQQDATLSVQRGAGRMGETEDAVRGMIDGITDWTFSSADAAAGMELLNQRGVDNMGTIEELLPAWDNFADATGQDFVKGMDDGQRALGAFGIGAEDAGDHMDTLTFLTNEVDVPLDRLSRQLRGNEEVLDDMGLGLDESAGLLAALGAQGMDGRDAVALFGRAVKGSEGDLDDLLGELGLTAAEFEEYTGKVQDAEGITERQADQANDLATPMERLGGFVENLGFRFGGLGEVAGMLAAPLGAIGPAMFGISQAGGMFAKILPTLGGALRGVATAFRVLSTAILTNPIFLIAALVIGIIAVIWHFREEIIEALVGAWDWVKEKTAAFWAWLTDATGNAVDAVVEWVQGLRERVAEFFLAMFEFVLQYHPLILAWNLAAEWVPKIIEWFMELRDRAIEIVSGWVESLVGWIVDLWTRYMEWGQSIRDGIVEWFTDLVTTVTVAVATWVAELLLKIQELRDNAVEFVGNLRDRVVEFISGMVDSVVSTVTGWIADLLGFVDGLRSDFTGTISSLVDDVVQFFKDLPGRIMDAFGNAKELLLDIGKDLIGGLIGGISGMATDAVETVGEVARDMVGAVTGVFRRRSPSKTFMDIGEDVIRGLQLGVENLGPSAIDEIERFANEATSAGQMGGLLEAPIDTRGRGTAVRPQEIGVASSGGVTWNVEQHVTVSDPREAADESVRRLRELSVLGGPFDPPQPEVNRG